MEIIRTFDDLLSAYRESGKRKRVAIVCPNDSHTQYVVRRCAEENLVDLTLFLDGGHQDELLVFCQSFADGRITTVHCSDAPSAALEAVHAVRRGEADVLMKGSLSTDVLLHAVIDKAGGQGLVSAGSVMSHVTLVQAPAYHKLLLVSDVAVIPNPGLNQFDAMIRHDADVCRRLGIECPKIALIHFSEKTNERFTVTTDYRTLCDRAAAGDYGNVEIAGPMDVKTACDAESAAIKHIESPVVGNADVLIMPDLEAGNTFYKTISYFGHALMAGLITGTTAPVVVASRADSEESKFFSLILACVVSSKQV